MFSIFYFLFVFDFSVCFLNSIFSNLETKKTLQDTIFSIKNWLLFDYLITTLMFSSFPNLTVCQTVPPFLTTPKKGGDPYKSVYCTGNRVSSTVKKHVSDSTTTHIDGTFRESTTVDYYIGQSVLDGNGDRSRLSKMEFQISIFFQTTLSSCQNNSVLMFFLNSSVLNS